MTTTTPKPPIAFIGLGAMGFGMATHLVKQGYPVTGFDVYQPTLDRFQSAGGQVASSPAAAVSDKPYCICMVATAQQAESVLLSGPNPAIPALPQGAVLLVCSTVPADWIKSLERKLHELGRGDILLVDAPVSGGAARAAEGTLTIMAGFSDSSADSLAKARPILEELADPAKLYIVRSGFGGRAAAEAGIGAGSNMKMAHQVLAAVQILAASEAMGFAHHLGLDLATTQKAVLDSPAWNWMFEHRTPRMLTNFQPVASAVNIIIKDTNIILSEARRGGFAVPMTEVAGEAYRSAVEKGYGPDDDSSLLRLYTEQPASGQPPADKSDEEKLGLVIEVLKAINLCAAAEALWVAKSVGLDLAQVLDLCVNAAGSSTMLKEYGPEYIRILKTGLGDAIRPGRADAPSSEGGSVMDVADKLETALEEARRLGITLFLAERAFRILQATSLRDGFNNLPIGALITQWAAGI
ncbi:hypothetical protein VTJ04DRAFT_4980 [Mycothermus thermophilus]|uniref:uncharacterized protein n=1 Tax=Humicola insolens TaxID=85995 RepID=UPI003742E877